jgi:hypothetical protein
VCPLRLTQTGSGSSRGGWTAAGQRRSIQAVHDLTAELRVQARCPRSENTDDVPRLVAKTRHPRCAITVARRAHASRGVTVAENDLAASRERQNLRVGHGEARSRGGRADRDDATSGNRPGERRRTSLDANVSRGAVHGLCRDLTRQQRGGAQPRDAVGEAEQLPARPREGAQHLESVGRRRRPKPGRDEEDVTARYQTWRVELDAQIVRARGCVECARWALRCQARTPCP